MPALSQAQLHERLVATESDLHQFGWSTPDYLFGLAHRSSVDGGMGLELWMEMPGGATGFLDALVDLNIHAAPTIDGLVIVSAGGHHGPEDVLGLPVLGRLRASCEQAGIDPEQLMTRMPVASPPVVRQRRSVRALLCVERDGETFVIVREAGGGARVEEQFPQDLGDHEMLRSLALRILAPM